MNETENLHENLVGWVRAQVRDARKEGAVFGLSGGLDSSVTAALCKEALGDKVLGLIMPCHGLEEDRKDALLVAGKFRISVEEVDLHGVYDSLVAKLFRSKFFSEDVQMTVANVKPRLRMIVLYFFAGLLNYLVVGTGNKSERMTGYFTKYGDGGADIFPLGNLVKGQVRELAAYLGVPQAIIDKAPSAGLWAGQTDEDELKITYDEIDRYLMGEELGEVAARIQEKIRASEHKRKLPPLPDL